MRLFAHEKGCENEYTEEVLEMTGKGDHKSWSELRFHTADQQQQDEGMPG